MKRFQMILLHNHNNYYYFKIYKCDYNAAVEKCIMVLPFIFFYKK